MTEADNLGATILNKAIGEISIYTLLLILGVTGETLLQVHRCQRHFIPKCFITHRSL